MNNHSVKMPTLIDIAKKAGALVLSFYNQNDLDLSIENPESPITCADRASHDFIKKSLLNYYPNIPLLSEEEKDNHGFEDRAHWEYFFMVDPLDGTKEFINKNDEFAINIALIYRDMPILGIIYAPALDLLYYAEKGHGAYKLQDEKVISLKSSKEVKQPIRVLHSRSHHCKETQSFIDDLKNKANDVVLVPVGSSLKFCWIAEGRGDVYPRFGPTMEWDTAAGDILVREAGKHIQTISSKDRLLYNKKSLVNPGFIVE